jgi:hypothetical protein
MSILWLVCLFTVIEVLAAPLAFGPPWILAQGAIVLGVPIGVFRAQRMKTGFYANTLSKPIRRPPYEVRIRRAA